MRFIVYSNLFIATAAGLVTHQTYGLLGLEPRWSPVTGLVFSATLLVYNLDRLSDRSVEDRVDASARHDWIEGHEKLLWGLTLLAGLGIAASLLFAPIAVFLSTLPLGLIALGYTLPIVPSLDGRRRLKDVAGLKIFLIVLVWIGATVLLPAVETLEAPLRIDVLIVALERGLFIFAITLPFDIRDLERDRSSNIRTIPMQIGVERTRSLALAAIAVFAAVVALHYGLHVESAGPPLCASALVTAVLLARADRERTEMYYVGQLDGTLALQWLLVTGWRELVA